MTQNTSTVSLFDRVCFIIAASTNDNGTPLTGKVADPKDLFGESSVGEKELVGALKFGEKVPEEWVMTVKIVVTAASAHHSFETLARNARRVKGRLEHLGREAQRPAMVAELAVLGVTLRNDRLPTNNVAELLAGAKDRKGLQCVALLDKLNRHREVLGEKPEELGVTIESSAEAIVARWRELDAAEREAEAKATARLQAKAAHLARTEEHQRNLDRKRGIRVTHPAREARQAAAPKGPVVETRDGSERRCIEKANVFTMPDAPDAE